MISILVIYKYLSYTFYIQSQLLFKAHIVFRIHLIFSTSKGVERYWSAPLPKKPGLVVTALLRRVSGMIRGKNLRVPRGPGCQMRVRRCEPPHLPAHLFIRRGTQGTLRMSFSLSVTLVAPFFREERTANLTLNLNGESSAPSAEQL